MMTDHHPLDIPEFLKRDKNETRATHAAWASHIKERKEKRPAGWHALTKAEQEGTADPATIALRKQLEADRKRKQAERFEALKALPKKPRMPKAAKQFKRPWDGTSSHARVLNAEKKTERYGVITNGGAVAFSFDATGSDDARAKLSAMRKAGEIKGVKVTSLRRLRPDDKSVDGKPIQHVA